jgi:hypothetical protein
MRILLVAVLAIASAWFAVNVVLGAVVAPAVFAHAPPAETMITKFQAGALFGDLLSRWIQVTDKSAWPLLVLTLGILSGYALRDRHRLATAACMIGMVALIAVHLWSGMVVAEAMAIRPPVKEAELASYSEETHAAFDALHHRSVTLFGIETALLLAIALAAAGVLARRHEPLRPSAADAPR